MTKASISLQDLRRRIYLKAKADQEWRFWGLYVHVCKPETLREAYTMARRNGGAAGIDGMTFDAIEEVSVCTKIEGAILTLFEGVEGRPPGRAGEVSHGRQRVKPLRGSSASLRPFG